MGRQWTQSERRGSRSHCWRAVQPQLGWDLCLAWPKRLLLDKFEMPSQPVKWRNPKCSHQDNIHLESGNLTIFTALKWSKKSSLWSVKDNPSDLSAKPMPASINAPAWRQGRIQIEQGKKSSNTVSHTKNVAYPPSTSKPSKQTGSNYHVLLCKTSMSPAKRLCSSGRPWVFFHDCCGSMCWVWTASFGNGGHSMNGNLSQVYWAGSDNHIQKVDILVVFCCCSLWFLSSSTDHY